MNTPIPSLTHSPMPRRAFLALAAHGVAGAVVASPLAALAPATPLCEGDKSVRHHSTRANTLKLGVASYSLRSFSRDQAIAMIKALRTPYVNLKSVHLPYELSAAQVAAARRDVENAGLQIVGGGMITFDRNSDDDVRKYFDYAKAAGMPLVVATASPETLPRIEKFAQLYNVKVAIHNHGPEDSHFPSPYDVLKAVRTMDRRMGLCIDVGHTVRVGTDVVQAVADAGPRLLDMHAKDLRILTVKESQCVVGEGVIPIAAIFRELLAMNYDGYVNLEYEIDADNPLPGMRQSFAYMRGVLAGLVPSSVTR
ncbi:MAG: hypothetical protein NVS4B3_25100 [Gemmatimonadaceae bacterium]